MTQTLISKERPLFWLVQGTDFGRSIAWSKRQPPNPVNQALKTKAQEPTESTEPTSVSSVPSC